MYLSKINDCLLHNLLTVKLVAYGVDFSSFLNKNYLSNTLFLYKNQVK